MANLATKQIFFNKIAKPYMAIKCFANADLGVWRVWGLSLKRCKNEFKSYQWRGFLGL